MKRVPMSHDQRRRSYRSHYEATAQGGKRPYGAAFKGPESSIEAAIPPCESPISPFRTRTGPLPLAYEPFPRASSASSS